MTKLQCFKEDIEKYVKEEAICEKWRGRWNVREGKAENPAIHNCENCRYSQGSYI